jgi:hypothetical protein
MLITFTLLAAAEAVVKQDARTDAEGGRVIATPPDYAERPRLGGTVKPRPFR